MRWGLSSIPRVTALGHWRTLEAHQRCPLFSQRADMLSVRGNVVHSDDRFSQHRTVAKCAIRAPGSTRVSVTNPGRAPISLMADQTSSIAALVKIFLQIEPILFPAPLVGTSAAPRRLDAATSIFFMPIITSNARFASSPPAASASVSTRGVIVGIAENLATNFQYCSDAATQSRCENKEKNPVSKAPESKVALSSRRCCPARYASPSAATRVVKLS